VVLILVDGVLTYVHHFFTQNQSIVVSLLQDNVQAMMKLSLKIALELESLQSWVVITAKISEVYSF
jgi:hypothetical protein